MSQVDADDFQISNLKTTGMLPFTLFLFCVFTIVCIDAFAEAYSGSGAQVDKVHIRLQQRNRRKCILTITGLANDLDLKRICKALKKNFRCNGAVVKDDEYGDVIQVSECAKNVVLFHSVVVTR